MVNKVKTGIIGLGAMGQGHLKTLVNDVPDCLVTAVCDLNPSRFSEAEEKGILNDSVRRFIHADDLFASGECEAVIVVTPHPSHSEISIAAFKKGLHVLCDKPLASKVSDAEKMLGAWEKTQLKFSTMHSMRTSSVNKVIKKWLEDGRLGEIRRVDMVCTKWLRTQAYYDEQEWRGTWKGEGAGILLNQAPHNLDLLYWWFGPAVSVKADVSRRFHDIETEDELDARIMMAAGFPVRFYATTGEAPGIDRVEIVGTKGTLVKTEKLFFSELEQELNQAIRQSRERMLNLKFHEKEVEVPLAERGNVRISRRKYAPSDCAWPQELAVCRQRRRRQAPGHPAKLCGYVQSQ